MAFEVPFVAFDLEETKAVAEGAALCLRQGDSLALARAIDELLEDPARRAEMARTGRGRVEEGLAWDRQEEACLRVYARLLGPGRSMVPAGGRSAREEPPLPDPDGRPYPARACRSWPSVI